MLPLCHETSTATQRIQALAYLHRMHNSHATDRRTLPRLAPSPGFSPPMQATPRGPAPPPSSPMPTAPPVVITPRGVPTAGGGATPFAPRSLGTPPVFPDVTSNDVTGHPQATIPTLVHYDRKSAQPQLQRVRKQAQSAQRICFQCPI